MAQRQALGGQQRLGLGTAQPGLEGRGHRHVVDLEQPLHPHQVEAEHAGEALAPGDQATGHRRTAAERHHGEVVLDREVEDGGDLLVPGRADDGVRGVAQVAGPGAEQVGRGLAAGAEPAGVVVGAHVLGADDAGEPVEHGGVDRGRRERRVRHGRPVVGAEDHLHQAAGLGRQRGGAGGVAPAGRVHLGLVRGHALHCDT